MPDYKICGGAKSGGCMDLCLKSSGFAKVFIGKYCQTKKDRVFIKG